jgi:hypothetical protein
MGQPLSLASGGLIRRTRRERSAKSRNESKLFSQNTPRTKASPETAGNTRQFQASKKGLTGGVSDRVIIAKK